MLILELQRHDDHAVFIWWSGGVDFVTFLCVNTIVWYSIREYNSFCFLYFLQFLLVITYLTRFCLKRMNLLICLSLRNFTHRYNFSWILNVINRHSWLLFFAFIFVVRLVSYRRFLILSTIYRLFGGEHIILLKPSQIFLRFILVI